MLVIVTPTSTPEDVVATLNAETVNIIRLPKFRKHRQEIGAEPIGDTPNQMAPPIKGDTAEYARLVKDAKASIDWSSRHRNETTHGVGKSR